MCLLIVNYAKTKGDANGSKFCCSFLYFQQFVVCLFVILFKTMMKIKFVHIEYDGFHFPKRTNYCRFSVLVDGLFFSRFVFSKTKGCHLSLSNTGRRSILHFCVKFDLMILWNSNVASVIFRLELSDIFSSSLVHFDVLYQDFLVNFEYCSFYFIKKQISVDFQC